MIANVLALTEEERVSLGLLSAWEVQLKQMMGGTLADGTEGSPHAPTRGLRLGGNENAGSLPKGISPQKAEHGPTIGGAGSKAEPSTGAGGGFGDLWATFLQTDV